MPQTAICAAYSQPLTRPTHHDLCHPNSKGRASCRCPPLLPPPIKLTLSHAELPMAAAAIVADGIDTGFERFEVFGVLLAGLDVCGEFCDQRLEVGVLFPDRRRGSGLIAGPRAIGEQVRHLAGIVGESGENLLGLGEIERRLP